MLNQVETGKMIGRESAEVLDLSLRQVSRLLAAYRKEGAQTLAHGNRGRKPYHALNEGQRKQVLARAQSTPLDSVLSDFSPEDFLTGSTYAGCNTQHFTELLAEREGIALSRSSVRRILLQVGIKSPRKRRPPKHRRRRERYPEEGFIPDEVFCFKYYRMVGADNVVCFGGALPGTLPGYQTSTAGGASTQGEEYSPGFTRHD